MQPVRLQIEKPIDKEIAFSWRLSPCEIQKSTNGIKNEDSEFYKDIIPVNISTMKYFLFEPNLNGEISKCFTVFLGKKFLFFVD